MPRGCRPASHSEPAGGGIDSTKQNSLHHPSPSPEATAVVGVALCKIGRSFEPAGFAVKAWRHNHDLPIRNQDEIAGGHVVLVTTNGIEE